MNTRYAKALIGAAALGVFTAGMTVAAMSVVAQEIPEVKFRFYNDSGTEMGYSAIVNRMTNGKGAGIYSAGNASLEGDERLRVVTLNENYRSGGKFTMPFDQLIAYPRQGMLVHWNTANTGYSTFLLDNEGQGFSQTETVNFNRRLALDVRRQFDAALASKRDGLGTGEVAYLPSAAFTALQGQIDGCFAQLGAAATESAKGRLGQQCADLVAQAMTVMMREYGIQRASSLGDRARWGVTIRPSTLAADKKKVDDLVPLFAEQHRWARIEMKGDGTDNLTLIKQIADYATSKGVKTMGQLFDSTNQANVPLATFKSRVDAALVMLGSTMTAWEVGNEANGLWLGADVPAKIAYAADKARALGKEVVLTFYWYGIEDEMVSSLFNWIYNNMTPELTQKVDSIALSIYVDEQPLNFAWDMVLTRLAELFPGKPVMSGELDFDPAGFYKEGPKNWTAEQGYKAYIQNRYASSFATRQSIGGGFWWYYDEDMVGRTTKWQALHGLYCGAHPTAGVCP